MKILHGDVKGVSFQTRLSQGLNVAQEKTDIWLFVAKLFHVIVCIFSGNFKLEEIKIKLKKSTLSWCVRITYLYSWGGGGVVFFFLIVRNQKCLTAAKLAFNP